MADRLLGTGSAVTDLKRTSDPVFFMDPFRWICHFDVVVFSDPRSLLFYFHADPDAVLIIFLCGVTIGVLDPDWIFYASFRSETPVLNLCVAHFFIWRRDPYIFSGSSKRCFSSFRIRPFYSRGSSPFTTIKIYLLLLTFLPCVIARDQGGGGGGRRRQRRRQRGLR